MRGSKLFEGLTDEDLELVARSAAEAQFKPGELITEGDPNNTFFVLLEGEVEVLKDGEVRRRLKPGDFFGEISVEQRLPATATVRAGGSVRALIFSGWQFQQVIGYEEVRRRIIETLVERLNADRGV